MHLVNQSKNVNKFNGKPLCVCVCYYINSMALSYVIFICVHIELNRVYIVDLVMQVAQPECEKKKKKNIESISLEFALHLEGSKLQHNDILVSAYSLFLKNKQILKQL